jgi:iron complex transport system substrate-binding protein
VAAASGGLVGPLPGVAGRRAVGPNRTPGSCPAGWNAKPRKCTTDTGGLCPNHAFVVLLRTVLRFWFEKPGAGRRFHGGTVAGHRADPGFCLIADLVKERGPIFKLNQPEMVIGFQPDLVFTVFYSDATFKTKLRKAKVPFFDLGYFGSVESIKKQTLLIGRIIGEEGNAEALVEIMDEKIQELRGKIPVADKAIRLLFYDKGGYIPGTSTNFNSICSIIKAVNVGSERGIKSWKQIDFETLLKWDPDVIIVPQGSNLKEQLMTNAVLSHARAIKNGRVHYIPGVYLSIDSQYLIVSANQLAGIVYENAF